MRQQGIRFLKMRIPYFFMMATWLPIYFFIYIVPDSAVTQFYQSLERIIDQELFGAVGMWSSKFPLVSKVVANYICLFAPVFAIIFANRALKKSTFEYFNCDGYSLTWLVFFFVSWAIVLLGIFYILYMDDTDLANARNRFAVLGRYKIFYALYSSVILYAIYVLVLVGYSVFRYFPVVIIDRVLRLK